VGQVFTIGLDIAKSVFQVDGGGYAEIFSSMDAAFAASNRIPDVVLSGHVHSYLRFSRALGGVRCHTSSRAEAAFRIHPNRFTNWRRDWSSTSFLSRRRSTGLRPKAMMS